MTKGTSNNDEGDADAANNNIHTPATNKAVKRKFRGDPQYLSIDPHYGDIVSASKRIKEDRLTRSVRTPRSKPKATAEGAPVLQKDEFLAKKDVVSCIMEYLDVKSLYKFALASKTTMQLLQGDVVVRAAMFHGGHPKTNVDRLISLTCSKKIMVPSPLRVLRLCIGRFCEHCQTKRVNLVSKQFGVFFCKDCMEQCGFIKTIRRFDCSYYPMVRHLYTIPEGCYGVRIWAKPYTDSEGNRVGPLQSLQCRLRKGEAHEETLAAIYKKDSQSRLRFLPNMEKAYKDNLKSANDKVLACRLQRRLASEAAQAKRNERICSMISSLSDELGDVSWKSVMLSYDTVPIRDRDRIVFAAPLAKDILEESLAAPSKITRARIKRLARHMKHCMLMFEAFHLNDFMCFEHDPRFRAHCLQNFPGYSLLCCSWVNSNTLHVLNRLYPHDRTSIIAHFLSQQMTMDEDRNDNV